jgi:hypothetical protein
LPLVNQFLKCSKLSPAVQLGKPFGDLGQPGFQEQFEQITIAAPGAVICRGSQMPLELFEVIACKV